MSNSLKFIEMIFAHFNEAIKYVSFPTFFILSSWAPFSSIIAKLIHGEILILAAYLFEQQGKRHRVYSGITVIGFTIPFFQRWVKIRRYIVDCTCSLWVNQCVDWHPGSASAILILKPFLAAHVAGAPSILTPMCHFQTLSWLTKSGVM